MSKKRTVSKAVRGGLDRSLIEKFRNGDLRSLSRLISLAENRDPLITQYLSELIGDAGEAKIYGITGPPGAGKSSLINQFVHELRSNRKKVAVVAVDPMSPFTGGSLLGDRIRLAEHFNDPNVYIRSLSTRGKLGGLSLATRESVALLDAFGFDTILIETVGVGQSEVDIRKIAHATLVVLVPESGDAVQVLKAGILEIGDVFVVNKSDRDGAEKVASELRQILELSGKDPKNVLLATQNDPATVRNVFTTLDAAPRRKTTDTAAVVLDWLETVVSEELGEWVKKNVKKSKNPYEWILKFRKKYPEGKLFK